MEPTILTEESLFITRGLIIGNMGKTKHNEHRSQTPPSSLTKQIRPKVDKPQDRIVGKVFLYKQLFAHHKHFHLFMKSSLEQILLYIINK